MKKKREARLHMNEDDNLIKIDKENIQNIDFIESEENCNSCGMDNYFDIISFKDRINNEKKTLDKMKNYSFKIFFLIMAYYFGSVYSGYIEFLGNFEDLTVFNIQILTGFLVLVVLSNLWGSFVGVFGGLIGDIIYQFVSLNTVKWEFTLVVVIFGLLSGLARYKKDETIPKLKIMKYFYSLIAGVVLSILFLDISISVIFLISEIISFLFLGPIVIMGIDRILKNKANTHQNVYKMVLTHHGELDADHAIPINIGGYNIFLCTRCTGTITGIIIGLFIQNVLSFSRGQTINPELALLSCIILPIPGLIDWGTQALHLRKSNDKSRIATGILLGISMHMLNFTSGLFIEMLMLVSLYFGIFFLLMYIRNKKTEYIIEY